MGLPRAVSAAPFLIISTTLLSLALAAVPALQVLLIAALISALGDAERLVVVAGLLLAMILVVGLSPSASSICRRPPAPRPPSGCRPS